ncbi:NTP transferase domain-containing protein [Pseudodesulfovibrio sp.]|uniref:cytidylyltransferase domain-containing protein n=1 Tax=Pseudodesulfovibrio sp. TaxID=2035812 RepID=UPI0026143DFA|nr:NTP transferase domain-containing protein [Pseudodesulfovibrio sp.]MDD3312392.1 NTP transferase domain-containing protein [Pseudodesulfovibrio sp.]
MGENTLPRTVALLGVRLTSQRLPHKALRLVRGRLALEHILERLDRAATVDEVVVCTSDEPVDDALADAAEQLGRPCFRGKGDDVLCRFYEAARLYGADLVVRALGDNLFPCTEHLDRQVRRHAAEGADWSTTDGLPWGMKAEVISFSALERAYRCAEDTSDSCDLTWFFDQPEVFRVLRLDAEPDCLRPDYRLTMDTPEDLVFLRALCERLDKDPSAISIREIVALLDASPDLAAINREVPDRFHDPVYRARVNTRILDTPRR